MKKDILNQTFGSLTVIKKLDSRLYNQYWLCSCICGNTIEKSTKYLTNIKNKKHCGCQDKKYCFLPGQKFNNLTIIKESFYYNNKGKKIRGWECQCHCGNIIILGTHTLIRGHYKSCGCGKPNYKVDLTGKTFSLLTVLSLDEERTKKSKDKYWICKCSCGNENTKSISTNALLSGSTESCGCLHNEWFRQYRISKGYNPDESMQPVKQKLRGRTSGKKKKLIKLRGNTCQLCHEEYSYNSLFLHHIIPISQNDSLYKEEKNLILLCRKCHRIAHNNNWNSIDTLIQIKLANITGLQL